MAKKQMDDNPKKTPKSKVVALMAKYGSGKKMENVKSASKAKEYIPPTGKVLDYKGRARQANAPELLTAMPLMRMPGQASVSKVEVEKKTTPIKKAVIKDKKEEKEEKMGKVKLSAPSISGTELKSQFKAPVAKILEIAKERVTEKVPVAIVKMGAHAGNFPFYPSFVRKVVNEDQSLSSKIDTTSADSIKESIDKMSQDDKINLYKKFEKFGIYGSSSTRKYQPTQEDLTRIKEK